uniref:Uncharacterized protein n=1 Tax=Romanomermis culicivorax TaxID=13658 RepID=A0A915I2I1_ROMCU
MSGDKNAASSLKSSNNGKSLGDKYRPEMEELNDLLIDLQNRAPISRFLFLHKTQGESTDGPRALSDKTEGDRTPGDKMVGLRTVESRLPQRPNKIDCLRLSTVPKDNYAIKYFVGIRIDTETCVSYESQGPRNQRRHYKMEPPLAASLIMFFPQCGPQTFYADGRHRHDAAHVNSAVQCFDVKAGGHTDSNDVKPQSHEDVNVDAPYRQIRPDNALIEDHIVALYAEKIWTSARTSFGYCGSNVQNFKSFNIMRDRLLASEIPKKTINAQNSEAVSADTIRNLIYKRRSHRSADFRVYAMQTGRKRLQLHDFAVDYVTRI